MVTRGGAGNGMGRSVLLLASDCGWCWISSFIICDLPMLWQPTTVSYVRYLQWVTHAADSSHMEYNNNKSSRVKEMQLWGVSSDYHVCYVLLGKTAVGRRLIWKRPLFCNFWIKAHLSQIWIHNIDSIVFKWTIFTPKIDICLQNNGLNDKLSCLPSKHNGTRFSVISYTARK